jgi:hypothetical protein
LSDNGEAGRRGIRVEGYTPEEIVGLPDECLDALALIDHPLVLQVGSAQVLGQFRIRDKYLTLELAHVDGGGEGALPALASIAERVARRRGLEGVEWIVHATRCANPNPKLRRVLERRGFTVREVPGIGDAYYYVHPLRSEGEQ